MAEINPSPAFKKLSHPGLSLGVPVLHYHQGAVNDPPTIGFVVSIGELTIDLAVLQSSGNPRLTLLRGVLHRDSPNLTDPIRLYSGCWDHTDFTKQLLPLFTNPKLLNVLQSSQEPDDAARETAKTRR